MSRRESRLAMAICSISVALLISCADSVTGPGDEVPKARQASENVIQIVTVTTGVPVDPNGYQLTIDGKHVGTIGIRDRRSIEGMAGSTHEVELSDVAANCEVRGGEKRSVLMRNGWGWLEYPVVCSDAEGLQG